MYTWSSNKTMSGGDAIYMARRTISFQCFIHSTWRICSPASLLGCEESTKHHLQVVFKLIHLVPLLPSHRGGKHIYKKESLRATNALHRDWHWMWLPSERFRNLGQGGKEQKACSTTKTPRQALVVRTEREKEN